MSLRSEAGGPAWQVWPNPEPVPPGNIQETGSYFFELRGSPDAGTAELLVDDRTLEALRAPEPNAALWRWSPGFHAGSIEAELRLQGQAPRRFEFVTDPDKRKLTRDDFDTMVREILEDSFALFSLSGFRKSVARGSGTRPPAIARLEFLRSRIDELEKVVADILRNPRRRLSAEEIILPYHAAGRATGPEILRSFRSGRVVHETGCPSRLPESLKGCLPSRIRVGRRRSSLDLPEHRQMGACLRSWAAWLGAVAEILDRQVSERNGRKQEAATWVRRCRILERRINSLAKAAPFAEAGEATPQLALSSVFRNDPAYRRFFALWQDMNLGIASVFGDFLNLPLARTFELYELWCFLRLVRAAADLYGAADLDIRDLFVSDAAGGVTIAAGAVTVPVGGGWKLCFQKQYREFWIEPDGRGSYSRIMAPDIVATLGPAEAAPEGRLIVLDSKYRIEDGLNDALSSIHTYRNALVTEDATGNVEGIVTAAYLLAPHVPDLRPGYRDTPLPGRLFHPAYRTGFRFGAVTLRPGMTPAEISGALGTIIADATASESIP
nr:DUF2357 domain-containing protein [Rhodoblastus acidophilus]